MEQTWFPNLTPQGGVLLYTCSQAWGKAAWMFLFVLVYESLLGSKVPDKRHCNQVGDKGWKVDRKQWGVLIYIFEVDLLFDPDISTLPASLLEQRLLLWLHQDQISSLHALWEGRWMHMWIFFFKGSGLVSLFGCCHPHTFSGFSIYILSLKIGWLLFPIPALLCVWLQKLEPPPSW